MFERFESEKWKIDLGGQSGQKCTSVGGCGCLSENECSVKISKKAYNVKLGFIVCPFSHYKLIFLLDLTM